MSGFGLKFKAETKAAVKLAEKIDASLSTPNVPLKRIGLHLQRRARGRLSDRPRRADAVSTAMLARSIYSRPDGDDAIVTGTNLKYAAVQQSGHPGITPKRGKALAIPVPMALKRSGKWPRDWPKGALKFIPSRSGGNVVGVLVKAVKKSKRRKKGKHAGINKNIAELEKRAEAAKRRRSGGVQYILVRKVTIPARPYLVWDQEAGRFAKREFARHAMN